MSDQATEVPREARFNALMWWGDHEAHILHLIAQGDPDLAYPPSGSDRFHPELWRPPHWRWFKADLADGVDRIIKLRERSKPTSTDFFFVLYNVLGATGGLLYMIHLIFGWLG